MWLSRHRSHAWLSTFVCVVGADKDVKTSKGGDAVLIVKKSVLILTVIHHFLTRFSAVGRLITSCPDGGIETFCLGVKKVEELRDAGQRVCGSRVLFDRLTWWCCHLVVKKPVAHGVNYPRALAQEVWRRFVHCFNENQELLVGYLRLVIEF